MAVTAAGSLVVSMMASTSKTATSVDGVAINLWAVNILRLFNKSGKGCRVVAVTMTVAMSVAMSVTMSVAMSVAVRMGIGEVVLNCAGGSSEASKSESFEHNEVS